MNEKKQEILFVHIIQNHLLSVFDFENQIVNSARKTLNYVHFSLFFSVLVFLDVFLNVSGIVGRMFDGFTVGLNVHFCLKYHFINSNHIFGFEESLTRFSFTAKYISTFMRTNKTTRMLDFIRYSHIDNDRDVKYTIALLISKHTYTKAFILILPLLLI